MISDMIRKLVATWGDDGTPVNPEQINSGDCCDFAEALFGKIVSAGLTSVLSIDSNDLIANGEGKSYWHVWVYHGGKHYDAETPDGVDDWEALPFFARWRRTAGATRPLWRVAGYERLRSVEDDAKAFAGMAKSMARQQARISRELARSALARHVAICSGCKVPGGCSVGDGLLVSAWG